MKTLREYIPEIWGTIIFLLLVHLFPGITFAASCAENMDTQTVFDQLRFGGATKYSVEFTLASECDVSAVSAVMNKYSSPADDAIFGIHEDSSGVPGTLIAEVNVPASDISTYPTFAETTATLDTCLEPGTYWFVVSKSNVGSTGGDYEWGGPAGSGGLTKAVFAGSWGSYTAGYDVDYTDFNFTIQDGGTSCVGGGSDPTATTTAETTGDIDHLIIPLAFFLFLYSMYAVINTLKPATMR